ncbi:3D domain-containing protein [Humisphaera borealis]|uniref:3D domain-containing protein n=1 Tax=Humisphaera borealis TaxID=2807512 RepID=A0A7M2X520_9BACT|nr:3D domain-containing protein [Humisphaera borealis]QOV91890.1 3D domain-containing protein [Humisphaera borealis]
MTTVAVIVLTAVAVFAPLASANSSKAAQRAAASGVASDAERHQALSSLVADHDAAARRAIEASRELTQDFATPASAKVSAARPAGGAELLRSAKDSAAAVAPARVADRDTRTIRMLVTAYCACKKCCGANARGVTASGKHVSYNGGRFVAADRTVLPLGTKLMIPGYHNETMVEVVDTGSAIKGNRLDVYYPSHQTALEWGKRWVDVVVVE